MSMKKLRTASITMFLFFQRLFMPPNRKRLRIFSVIEIWNEPAFNKPDLMDKDSICAPTL
jgi:hypothetical protein